MRRIEESYSLVVCGGGLAGFCAAVAAARNGVRTCLIHDRPVFGGNSSSEIRVTPHGAGSFHAYARETGVLSELLIELLARNHELMSEGGHNAVWDQTLYEFAMNTPNLRFYLNTSVFAVNKSDHRTIESVAARIAGAETELVLRAKLFADCTGDGTVADLAGSEWRLGTEGREDTGEPHAPLEASADVMGSSILFKAVDAGRPVPFFPPEWAHRYDDASFFYERGRGVSNVKRGYWWIAISVPWHTIHENEDIRHQLTRHVLGVWDWIKNKDPRLKEKAASMALDWVGQVPGKRESRRIMGKYLMTEHDVLSPAVFPDEVAFGGWYIDLHSPYGLLDDRKPELSYGGPDNGAKPSLVCGPYGIPLRILLSKDIDNLMMAGRNVSVTHVALGTVRVMATTALMGQAVGTAAAVSLRHGVEIGRLPESEEPLFVLRQQLLRDGCFLPHSSNEDPADLARQADVTASSEALLYGAGPESKGYVLDLTKHIREKRVDESEPIPGARDELLQRRGQWIAVGTDRIERISVCLSNPGDSPQTVRAMLLEVDHIWDYRLEGLNTIEETELTVKPGTYQWVDWDVNAAVKRGGYVRLDLHPNPEVIWHCAGAVEPGMMSAFDIGSAMRRYKYGRTLSFRIEPAQPCYGAGNILSGVTRPYRATNLWRSDPNEPLPQWVQLTWDAAQDISQVEITFAGHLFRDFERAGETPLYRDPQTPKDYRIWVFLQGDWRMVLSVSGNYQRHRIHKLDQPVQTDRLRLEILSTNGDPSAAVYEIRCYR